MIKAKWIPYAELNNEEKKYVKNTNAAVYLIAYENGELSGYGSIDFSGKKVLIESIYSSSINKESIIDLLLRMIIRKNYDSGQNDIYVNTNSMKDFYLKFGFAEGNDGLLKWSGDVGGCC